MGAGIPGVGCFRSLQDVQVTNQMGTTRTCPKNCPGVRFGVWEGFSQWRCGWFEAIAKELKLEKIRRKQKNLLFGELQKVRNNVFQIRHGLRQMYPNFVGNF